NVFTYTYLSGTQLISGYTAINPSTGTTNVIVSRNYELNRNLITAITNSVSSVPSVVSSFDYRNDSTGKRTSRIDYYNGSTVTNTYDGENRLISSKPDYWGTTKGACMFGLLGTGTDFTLVMFLIPGKCALFGIFISYVALD
ncbi:MAG: hypothetical protein WC340_06515, partial [Kiritimatiellia bacterium]